MGLMHLFVIFAVVIVIIALYFGDLLLYHLNNKKRKIDNDCDDKLDFSKQICSSCKTGRDTYSLDNHSDTCPYIASCENNKCHYYKPLGKIQNYDNILK